MAQPTVLAGTKLVVLLGDGATPTEAFTAPCGVTTKTWRMSASTNTTLIPDCDDPEAPAWEATDVNAMSAQLTGSGVMATESFDIWNDWFTSAVGKNVQIELDDASLGHWLGSFIITELSYGGSRGQKVTIDFTMKNNGAVVWVPNP